MPKRTLQWILSLGVSNELDGTATQASSVLKLLYMYDEDVKVSVETSVLSSQCRLSTSFMDSYWHTYVRIVDLPTKTVPQKQLKLLQRLEKNFKLFFNIQQYMCVQQV